MEKHGVDPACSLQETQHTDWIGKVLWVESVFGGNNCSHFRDHSEECMCVPQAQLAREGTVSAAVATQLASSLEKCQQSRGSHRKQLWSSDQLRRLWLEKPLLKKNTLCLLFVKVKDFTNTCVL